MTAGARLDVALRRDFSHGSICGVDPEHPLAPWSVSWTIGEG
jgi:hypothetical protein